MGKQDGLHGRREMKHSPTYRKRTARVHRPQSLRRDYITTSFGNIPKRKIWEGIFGSLLFVIVTEATCVLVWAVYWL